MFGTRKKKDPLADLASHPAAGNAFDDPRNVFADQLTGHKVMAHRMFLVALMSMLIAGASCIGMYHITTTRQVERLVVEVAPDEGVRGKPVRVTEMAPSEAVMKAELAKWVEKVMSIDQRRTPDWLKEANSMTAGKAVEQFRQWRESEGIYTKLSKEPDYVRTAKVTSVDTTTPGVAQVWVTTRESRFSAAPANPVQYRVRLDYTLSPPKSEQEIYENPLGLFVTFFEPSKQRL